MRSEKKLFGLLLSVAACGFMACAKSDEVSVRKLTMEKDAFILEEIMTSDEEGIPFPEGSKVVIKDGVHYLTLPESYTYYVAPVDGEKGMGFETPVIGVKCNCDEGKGCNPAEFNNKYYCIQEEGGYQCTRTNIYAQGNERNEPIEVEVLGMLNRNVGITYLCENHVNESDSHIINCCESIRGIDVIHGNGFRQIFEIEDVAEYIKNAIEWYAQLGVEPNGLAYFNIFGNVAVMPVYTEDGECFICGEGDKEYRAMTVAPGKEPTCECNEEASKVGGSCNLFKQWVPGHGYLYICETDDCKSCSLLHGN